MNPTKEKILVGNDGADVLGKLHSVPADKPSANKHDLIEADFNDLIQGNLAAQIRRGAGATAGIVNEAKIASRSIFEHIGDIGKTLAQKATTNKSATTAIAALAAVYSGILAIKNFVHSVKLVNDPKGDPKVSWIFFTLQGALEAGLALGLASPFLGIKSFFTKVIDGRSVVQMRTMIGAIVAPMLLGTSIKIAQNASIFNKLPFGMGSALGTIFGTISGATREITTPPEYKPNPNEPGAGLAAAPAFGG